MLFLFGSASSNISWESCRCQSHLKLICQSSVIFIKLLTSILMKVVWFNCLNRHYYIEIRIQKLVWLVTTWAAKASYFLIIFKDGRINDKGGEKKPILTPEEEIGLCLFYLRQMPSSCNCYAICHVIS